MPGGFDVRLRVTDSEFDELLRSALAPLEGPADGAFVARVDRAVVESERYRRWRRNLWRQLGGESLALAALAASLAVIARIPDVRDALAHTPVLAWPALLSLLVLWLFVARAAPSRSR